MKDEFIINISKKKACTLIKNYYRDYQGFDGEISFKKRSQDEGEDWGGFKDYIGRIDIVFSKKKKLFGENIVERSIIEHQNIPLTEIFSTMLQEDDYDITCACFNVIAYDSNDVEFKGVHLWVKKKTKNKILKK